MAFTMTFFRLQLIGYLDDKALSSFGVVVATFTHSCSYLVDVDNTHSDDPGRS